MKNSQALNYRRPFWFALAFHITLLLAFLFRFNFHEVSSIAASPEIVQATLVTEMPVSPAASAPVSVPPPAEQPPLTEKNPSPPVEELSAREEETSRIDPVKEAQEEVEKSILLEKVQQAKKMAIEKKQRLEKEKRQKLQADIQHQIEKEQQPKKAQVLANNQQKKLEELLQRDLAASSTEKSSAKSASTTAKENSSSASIDNKEIDRYKSLIVSAISHQWIVPENLKKGLECRLKVHVAAGGMVIDVKLAKSSGDLALDHSAQTAVYKASPLPVPKNAALFGEFREFNLTVRPEGILAG